MTDTDERAGIDPETRALLLNDMRGLSKAAIGQMVATLAERMGVDPALAPVDILTDKDTGAIRLYINADADLDVDIRDTVVIVKLTVVDPTTGRRRTDVGASAYKPDWPKSLADAVKKATTSAHRRATLGMVGIFLNEPAELVDADA
jgi:hypothetical protein